MSTDIAPTKAFEERMFEKIRDQMGDLMTDDDLRKLVGAAMQKAFFEPRVQPGNGYGSPTTLPPLFVALIEKQMTEAVRAAVSQWVADHPEEVAKVLKETIEAGIFNMMASHFASKTSWPLQQLLSALQAKGVL